MTIAARVLLVLLFAWGPAVTPAPALAATPYAPDAETRVINAWPAADRLEVAAGSGERKRTRTVAYLESTLMEVPLDSPQLEVTVGAQQVPVSGVLAADSTLVIGPSSIEGRLPAARLIPGSWPTPDATAALRILAAAPDLTGAATFLDDNQRFGPVALMEATDYAVVPAGDHTLDLRVDGTTVRSRQVTLAPGSVSTVLLRGFGERAVGIDVITDAAGLSRLPKGFPTTDGPASSPDDRANALAMVAAAFAACATLGAFLWRGRRRRTSMAAVATALAMGLAGCRGGATGPAGRGQAPGAREPEASADHAQSQPGPGAPPSGITGLRLPSHARSGNQDLIGDIVALGITSDGRLQAPQGPNQVSHLSLSPQPGEPGPAVFLGHSSSAGRDEAVFGRLERLVPGDAIEIVRGDETLRFIVYGLSSYDKDTFPADTAYRPTVGSELRLITCVGPREQRPEGWVRSENLVVSARLQR